MHVITFSNQVKKGLELKELHSAANFHVLSTYMHFLSFHNGRTPWLQTSSFPSPSGGGADKIIYYTELSEVWAGAQGVWELALKTQSILLQGLRTTSTFPRFWGAWGAQNLTEN